jgi:hypothetical protein
MRYDANAAADFMAAHGRTLDRRRFELLLGAADRAGVLAALGGYGNPDGGYGWGLEPDLRSPESQTGAALHAFEVFGEITPATSPRAAALCDWLESVTLPDGGLPFALPLQTTAGSARWWVNADPSQASLQITSIVAANAYRVARHDDAVAEHPWLERATAYCVATIDALDDAPFAIALGFSIRFADALYAAQPELAGRLLERLAKFVPEDGRLRVTGGAEDEMLRPLDIAPTPGIARTLFTDELIEADLERLAGLQQADGGWIVDFPSASPAAALEWRGYATVRALQVLRHAAGTASA